MSPAPEVDTPIPSQYYSHRQEQVLEHLARTGWEVVRWGVPKQGDNWLVRSLAHTSWDAGARPNPAYVKGYRLIIRRKEEV